MVDIIGQRQSARKSKTIQIKTMIMPTLESGRKVDYKRLVMEVRTQLMLADRTAKEYIENAVFELKKTKAEVFINEKEKEKRKEEIRERYREKIKKEIEPQKSLDV